VIRNDSDAAILVIFSTSLPLLLVFFTANFFWPWFQGNAHMSKKTC